MFNRPMSPQAQPPQRPPRPLAHTMSMPMFSHPNPLKPKPNHQISPKQKQLVLDPISLQKEESYLSDMLKEYEHKLGIELMLKTSAESMAKAHSDKKARKKAEEEIQFSWRRIELLSTELVKFVSRYRDVVGTLREIEAKDIQSTHQALAQMKQATSMVSGQPIVMEPINIAARSAEPHAIDPDALPTDTNGSKTYIRNANDANKTDGSVAPIRSTSADFESSKTSMSSEHRRPASLSMKEDRTYVPSTYSASHQSTPPMPQIAEHDLPSTQSQNTSDGTVNHAVPFADLPMPVIQMLAAKDAQIQALENKLRQLSVSQADMSQSEFVASPSRASILPPEEKERLERLISKLRESDTMKRAGKSAIPLQKQQTLPVSGTLSSSSDGALASAQTDTGIANRPLSESAMSADRSALPADVAHKLRKLDMERLQLEEKVRAFESHYLTARRLQNEAEQQLRILQVQLADRGFTPDHFDHVSDVAAARSACDLLQTQLSETRAERDKLQQSLKDAVSKHDQHVAEVAEWKRSLATGLQSKLAVVESALSTNRAAEKTKMEDMQVRVDALTANVSAMQAERDEARFAIEGHLKTVSDLKAAKAKAEEDVSALCKEIKSLKGLLDARDASIDRLRNSFSQTQKQLAEAEEAADKAASALEDIKRLNEENSLLRTHLESARTDKAMLEREKAALETQISDLNKTLQDAQAHGETSVMTMRQIEVKTIEESARLQAVVDKTQLELRTSKLRERELSDQVAAFSLDMQLLGARVRAEEEKAERMSEEHRERVKQLSDEVSTLKEQISALVLERDALQSRCSKAESELATAQQQHLEQASANASMDEQRKQIQHELNVLSDRLKELESQLAKTHNAKSLLETELSSATLQIQELQQTHVLAKQTNQETLLQLQQANEAKIKLQDTHKEVSDMLQRLQEQLREKNEDARQIGEARSVLETKLAEAVSESQALQSKLNEALADMNRIRFDSAKELDRLKDGLSRQQDAELQKVRAGLVAERDALAARYDDLVRTHDAEKVAMSARLLDLQTSLDQLSQECKTLRAKGERLGAAESSLAKLNAEHETVVANCKAANDMKKMLESDMDKLRLEISRLKQADADRIAQSDVLSAQITKLETDLKNVVAERDSLRCRFDASEDELRQLQQDSVRTIADVSAELRIAQETRDKLSKTVDELQMDLLKRNASIEQLTESHAKLKSEIAGIRVTRETLAKRIVDLESQLEVANRERVEANRSHEQSTLSLESASKLVEDARKHVAELESQLANVNREKDEAVARRQEIESQLAELESKMTSNNAANLASKDEVQALLQRTTDSEKRASELVAQLGDLESRHKASEQARCEAFDALETLQGQHNAAKMSLEQEIARMTKELAEMQASHSRIDASTQSDPKESPSNTTTESVVQASSELVAVTAERDALRNELSRVMDELSTITSRQMSLSNELLEKASEIQQLHEQVAQDADVKREMIKALEDLQKGSWW